jgi:hypothetical protein
MLKDFSATTRDMLAQSSAIKYFGCRHTSAPPVETETDVSSFARKIIGLWADLGFIPETSCKPQRGLFAVARSRAAAPQPGIHNWVCPNLMSELMRTRRQKLASRDSPREPKRGSALESHEMVIPRE